MVCILLNTFASPSCDHSAGIVVKAKLHESPLSLVHSFLKRPRPAIVTRKILAIFGQYL